MKTLRIIAVVVLVANLFCLQAQTITIHKVNGTKLEYHCSEVDSIVNYQIMPETEEHEAVDLGLSVLWATCNVGAEKPYQKGDEYAWGETEPKEEGTQDNYWFYSKETKSYKDLGEDISGTIYDAARQEWGGNWRMPTREEMEELMTKCSWKWVEIYGSYGFLITGPNGNQINLPTPDYKYNSNSIYERYQYRGRYWSGSFLRDVNAYNLNLYGYYNCLSVFEGTRNKIEYIARFSTFYIRPVKNK